MVDRLTSLITEFHDKWKQGDGDWKRGLAEYLIDNGYTEVKHGHWIVVGKTEGGSNILKCSVCGKVRRGVAMTPYCKDCGAKNKRRGER